MSRFTPVSRREFLRRLKKLGFEGPRPGAKHPFMVRNGRPYRIPNPHGSDISVDLLKRVLKQMEITRTEWESVARRS